MLVPVWPSSRVFVTLAALVALGPACRRARPSTDAVTPSATTSASATPRAGYYMGRRIAPTMSHEAAGWLVRPEREAEESASRMLKELPLRAGDVACDLGAGNGFHTLEMAKRVAPDGRAIAIDIQPEMLKLLAERAKAASVQNVQTLLGAASDPKLPDATCDLILLSDVYHELDEPSVMLGHLKRALTSRGVIALLEFRAEDPEVPIKPEHKMSKKQILLELRANGFELTRAFDELPWQHLMFFAPAKR